MISMSGLVSSTFATRAGIDSISVRISLYRSSEMVPLALASFRAMRVRIVIWVVNALVEATPISGPACV